LRKHGVRIKLNSQPFKVLTMLLERSSVIVTREEMRQRLWGTETFVGFDHGLNTAVNKIREALGDSASVPRYVETIPGKGYRFLAPVSLQSPASTVSDEQVAAADNAVPTSTAPGLLSGAVLTTPDELPVTSRMLVQTLLVLVQLMYLGFYLGALANLENSDRKQRYA
jgi:DNA-binding winged helix-turn-helix (wHTH) protein